MTTPNDQWRDEAEYAVVKSLEGCGIMKAEFDETDDEHGYVRIRLSDGRFIEVMSSGLEGSWLSVREIPVASPITGVSMKRKAFTLVEVLVVIAILAILASVIYLGLNHERPPAQVTRTAIASTLSYSIEKIDYQGNSYLVVSGPNGLGICPATPPKAESTTNATSGPFSHSETQ
jgi:prepilin-type N-terminal cleavage/methylation domain-containing protein